MLMRIICWAEISQIANPPVWGGVDFAVRYNLFYLVIFFIIYNIYYIDKTLYTNNLQNLQNLYDAVYKIIHSDDGREKVCTKVYTDGPSQAYR